VPLPVPKLSPVSGSVVGGIALFVNVTLMVAADIEAARKRTDINKPFSFKCYFLWMDYSTN
jgi:hypothetical protein